MIMSMKNLEESSSTYIIAELSANHNGSLENALATVDAAKEAGADAIKLQTYTADTITLNCDSPDFVISSGTLWDGKTLYELYDEAHTPWDWHEQLFARAREIGIDIFSSPFDESAVDFLEQFDPVAYKIASFEITDHELIRYTASKGRPMIVSTGIATMNEIQEAVDICRSEGNDDIVLLKCTSSYPAPLEAANLATIPNLAETFNVIAGFSDHTMGISAPVIAVALGAKVIEKHFILDKKIGGPDAAFSLDKGEFTDMVKAVRDAEKLIGRIDYSIGEKSRSKRQFARSLYVAEDIPKGGVITSRNIRSVRPGYGLHPRHYREIIGKHATRPLLFGQPLSICDVEDSS